MGCRTIGSSKLNAGLGQGRGVWCNTRMVRLHHRRLLLVRHEDKNVRFQDKDPPVPR